jgi:polyphosphate kinase 2 (PPK2 family)
MTDFDPSATPGFPGAGKKGSGKKDAPKLTAGLETELSELQERLFANGRAEPDQAPRVLVVLQGMDTSGKGGIVRHAMSLVEPQGVAL